MRIDILTIFPEMIRPALSDSILKRAVQTRKADLRVHDIRDYTTDKHKKVDDRPFGGGPGMVMTPQPIFDAIKAIRGRRKVHILLTAPAGRILTQEYAKTLAKHKNIIIICGHYEGIDARVRERLVDEAVSIGDYVLTGGELPALVITDCVVRLIPGVLGKADSLRDESFESGLLEYPQYTRPASFRGHQVPDVLLSGHHRDIVAWRHEQALKITKSIRPDLLKDGS